MAKVTSEKKYSSFIRGLITEASALTFPENASLDEENFDLNIDGSRARRLGVDYEQGYSLISTGIATAILDGTKKSCHRWDFPGGATDVVIGVVRAYDKLWFLNLLASAPSAALLNGGASITISGLANAELRTTVINNVMVLVSTDLTYPILLEYNPTTDVVSQSTYPILVRDVWGVNDGLRLQDRPATLSETHHYNLLNQGWSDTISATCGAGATTTGLLGQVWSINSSNTWVLSAPIGASIVPAAVSCTFTTLGVYPSNSDIWTLGKIGDVASADFEKFDPNSLVKNSIDNTSSPKGAFIIDAFKRGYSRRIATGLTTLVNDEETGRLACVASYAGRVWYSGVASSVSGGDADSPNYSGYIFFSQTIVGKDRLGKCYQEADPTSPNVSDIIDTDGGTVQLPDVSKVVALIPVKDSLLVFAENGVWEIYGDTGGFKATNYQTAKVSSIGANNPRTIVVAGNIVFYWSSAGIFMLSPDPATGKYVGTSITIGTIQTYYNNLSQVAKNHARGFFDADENHIRWLYNDTAEYSETANVNHYNRQLNLDLSLNAFYKFKISSLATNSPAVCDFVEIPPYAESTVLFDVYASSDPVIVGADPVVVNGDAAVARAERYGLLSFVGTQFTVSKYRGVDFMDWKTADGVGVDYSSYLITGYETFGEIMRSKQVPHVFFYLTRTEDGFTADANGNLIPNNQSSCMVQAQWNWSNSAAGGKWGTPFQAYRYTRGYTPVNAADTYDTGDLLIVTKNKLRGSGKALSLKIYSEVGKDLHLLGWAVSITGDGSI